MLYLPPGGANYQYRDDLYAFHLGIHRSHNLGHFQAYYGVGLTLGSYEVQQYDGYFSSPPRYIRDTVVRIPASKDFFGAYGFNGGLNYVISNERSEWRVLGLETSIQNEFGRYLNFRKSIRDSAIDILATDNWTRTLGIATDFVVKRRRGTEVGYKIAIGESFVSSDSYQGDSSHSKPFYFSNTFHLKKGNVISFIQLNFGNKTASFQMGVNVRLGCPTPKCRTPSGRPQ